MANAKTKSLKPVEDGGYIPRFIGGGISISFPKLKAAQKKDLVKFGAGKSRLDYIHYSVVMCRSRRLAYFSAVNIDGTQWKDNSRKGTFRPDPRLTGEDQLGRALYSAKKSDFDQGHLVRREDPEWGDTALSKRAGQNTFWYPNCAPQHLRLNRKIWGELEANILHTGASDQKLRISVFTGPVLAETDGVFVTKVKGRDIQIPNLFWKVVVWKKSDGKLYAVGFLQSQEKFLIESRIIKKQLVARPGLIRDEDIFEHLVFKDGRTYQVRISEIEQLTGISFKWKGVRRPFKQAKPRAISGTVLPKPRAAVKVKGLAAPVPNMKMTMKLQGLVL